MTLDELIDALEELRTQAPAAGLAVVNGVDEDAICYEHGEVWIGYVDDEEDTP